MIEKLYRFSCDDCKNVVREYPHPDAAKAKGWAKAQGGKICYCPACALKHRSVGCKGVQKTNSQQITLGEV